MLNAQKLIKEQQSNNSSKEYIIDLHHNLMKEYGWIPFDEFKNLPLVTCMNLVAKINQDRERENNEYKKINNKKR